MPTLVRGAMCLNRPLQSNSKQSDKSEFGKGFSMADINKEMQERVWQRVRGQAEPMQAEPGEPGVQALLLGELTDAALLRKAGGDALNTLARQAAERADILRGICILTQTDAPGKLPPAKEPGPAVLRLLMGSLLRRQKEYCRLQ